MGILELTERMRREKTISLRELQVLLGDLKQEEQEALFFAAREAREQSYGKDVFLRGLIEFTNYCKNDCYYCGIRKSCRSVERYRLTEKEILACAEEGYRLGFRTFVLQGGEDLYFTAERIAEIVAMLHAGYPDCAITLSVGERSRHEYKLWFECGADRYLLRHETASVRHYGSLHPPEMSLADRKACLRALKEIGYQTGAGFMVGSPGQTVETIYEDICFLQELQPQMIGIGPFIPARDTPFSGKTPGSMERTLRLLAILRLLFPSVLLPATTALATLEEDGRIRGLLAGANVVMPNLSPMAAREKYKLYDHKIFTKEESAQSVGNLQKQVEAAGYRLVSDRGDYRQTAPWKV